MAAQKVSKDMAAATAPVQRLCNEIQLFDLCDLDTCSYKDGKFCCNAEYLSAFERISDAEVIRPEVFASEELEEGEDGSDEGFDDAFEDDGYGEEAEYDD